MKIQPWKERHVRFKTVKKHAMHKSMQELKRVGCADRVNKKEKMEKLVLNSDWAADWSWGSPHNDAGKCIML